MTRAELDAIENDMQILLNMAILYCAVTGLIYWPFILEYRYQAEIYQQYE